MSFHYKLRIKKGFVFFILGRNVDAFITAFNGWLSAKRQPNGLTLTIILTGNIHHHFHKDGFEKIYTLEGFCKAQQSQVNHSSNIVQIHTFCLKLDSSSVKKLFV